ALLSRWLGLEQAAALLVARPVMRLARGLAVFDDQVLDRAVLAIAHGSAALGRAAARADDGDPDRLVTAVRPGARRPRRAARRPRAGRLSPSSRRATVVLAVLAVAFVLAVIL